MRNFINSFISIIINIIITLLFLLLIFIIVIIIFSKLTDIEVEDTVSYIQSFITNDSDFELTDKDSVNISYTDTNQTTNKNTKKCLFYYEQLDKTSKTIYDALNNNIDNLKTGTYTIKFNTAFNKLLHESNGRTKLNSAFQTAIDAFFYDHPELFYVDLSKMYLHIKYTSIGSKTTYTVSIAPEENKSYLSTGFNSINVNTSIKKVENMKNTLINSIPNNRTDYEKALKVHDTLVSSLEYDISASKTNAHNVYGALIEKKVVCEGYAKAFKYIMDSLNIECILVSGIATNSSGDTESHMWNYIKLNNKWYGVDVTWDDPISTNSSAKNIIRHNYFCKSAGVFNESHDIDKRLSKNGMAFTYPVLSSTNYK